MQVTRIGHVNRNEEIKNAELKREVNLLPKIAQLAKSEELEIFLHKESIFEGMGLPAMASAGGKFFGAPVTDALAHKRFNELKKNTGAYQGGDNYI